MRFARLTTLSIAPLAAVLAIAMAAPASAAEDPVVEAQQAIGAGDGTRAAEIIRGNRLAGNPKALGEIIYHGGVIAVRDGNDDEFTHAVATAFVEGEVNFLTAQLAYGRGVMLVAANAANDPRLLQELAPGGVAALRTELAYLGVRLPPLPLRSLPDLWLPFPLF